MIEDMFDDVLYASETKAREKAFIDLRQLLAVHDTAEEMVVHPRARRDIDGGVPVVDARLEEERDAKEQLSRLERMDMNSQEFLNELIVFRDEVIDHAQHEENEEFNQLQGELDPDDLKRMASGCWPPRPSPRPGRTPESSRRSTTSLSDRSLPCLIAPAT